MYFWVKCILERKASTKTFRHGWPAVFKGQKGG